MKPIFGYGSLILPTSLVSRFEDIDTNIDAIYEGNIDNNISADALRKWQERKDRIFYIPAKIYGFRRYYSMESNRGGTMLEAVRTGDSEDWINGVLIFGLEADEEEQIKQSESIYKYSDINNPKLEFYVDNDNVSEIDLNNIKDVRIFAKNNNINNISTQKIRNQTYHSRIITGIMMIGEMYDSDLATQFYKDFCDSTYESAYDSTNASKFNTVRENNTLEGESNERFDGNLQDYL